MYKSFTFTFFLLSSLVINAQCNVAHLNTQDVMDVMPTHIESMGNLEVFKEKLKLEWQEMMNDFDEGMQVFQDMMENSESPTLIRIQQDKLEEKQVAIVDREESIQMEIDMYAEELRAPVIEILNKALDIVAERNQYYYVMDISSLMVAKGPDITQEVIAEVLKLDTEAATTPK